MIPGPATISDATIQMDHNAVVLFTIDRLARSPRTTVRRRSTGKAPCADARRAIVAALAGTGARVHGSGTGRTSVCVECRLAYTLRTGGVALCGGLAAEGIVRWRGVRADGSASTQGPVPLAISADAGRFVRLAGRTAPVLFEHPVEGRCGATAAAMVGRPWALCPHDLC